MRLPIQSRRQGQSTDLLITPKLHARIGDQG